MHLSSVNWRARLVVTTLALGSFFSPITIRAGETALDRYVKKPDATYAWKVLSTVKAAGTTQFVVELTSQTWLAPKEVDRPVWKHWLVITKPDNATATTAFLFIGGGNSPTRCRCPHPGHRQSHRRGHRRAENGTQPDAGIFRRWRETQRGRPNRLHLGLFPENR